MILRLARVGHPLLATPLFNFSKKPELKKRKSEAPKPQAKSIEEYIRGPQQFKKNMLEVKQMQTTSQANIEEDSLKSIIVEQRTRLQTSLLQEIEQAAKKVEVVEGEKKRSLLDRYLVKEQLNKYYVRRPLKYLENIYYSMFLVNAGAYSWLEFTTAYADMGWFFGCFTAPAAASALALLMGYNLAFWIVRQAFHLHLPLADIPTGNISLISTTWRNIAELSFLAMQYSALIYCISFGSPIALYKLYILLGSTSICSLLLNLHVLLQATQVPSKLYIVNLMRIVSLTSLLLLVFAVYHIQITAGQHPQTTYEDRDYRERIQRMRGGYLDFLSVFKKKKYLMQRDEKINAFDE